MHHPAVDVRLAACERQIRALRRALAFTAGLLACAGVLVLVGFAGRESIVPLASPTTTDSLRVRELIVVDDSGTVRARVGGNLPDAIIRGKRVSRGDRAAGVLLYDNTGTERGGYVTFDRSSTVALTLDTRGRQVALFAADSTEDSGAAARLWRGQDWTEMRVDEGGPHITVGRNGSVVVMEPMMTAVDAAAMCTDLKREVAQVKPPPSATAVLEACKAHAPDGVCRKCLGLP
jgi:hypothetical protein